MYGAYQGEDARDWEHPYADGIAEVHSVAALLNGLFAKKDLRRGGRCTVTVTNLRVEPALGSIRVVPRRPFVPFG
jgi:hypothetical protein